MLATMIAGGYQVDPKKGNPGMDFARQLAIDPLDAAMLADAEKRNSGGTSKGAANTPEPAIGSYERLMSAFGGKLQPAGEDAPKGAFL